LKANSPRIFKPAKLLCYVTVLPVYALTRLCFYNDLTASISLQQEGHWHFLHQSGNFAAELVRANGTKHVMMVLVIRFPHRSAFSGRARTQKVAKIPLILSSMLAFRHFSAVARYCFSAGEGPFPERRMRSPRTMACNWFADCSSRSLMRM
jgi:hypothetical protein